MFKNYITTLLEEKGIDLQETFIVDMNDSVHIYEYNEFIEDLVEVTKSEPQMRKQIKQVLTILDFNNTDITNYINHLATGIVKQYQAVL